MTEGRDWYEGQREGLAAEFLKAVDEVFDRIRETPDLYGFFPQFFESMEDA